MNTPTISSQTSLESQVKLITAEELRQTCQTVNTALVDGYRQLKRRQQEAENDSQRKQALTEEIMATEEYQEWLKKELKRDERRKDSNKRVAPLSNQERVGYYIWAAYKGALLSVILTASFSEGKNRWGKLGYWREQKFVVLTGIAVLDIDHLSNAPELAQKIRALPCFDNLGILWLFVTPSGAGIKVVFRANIDGNLMDNAYDMAQLLSEQCGQNLLPYTDGQCKNADHTHFTPKADDILYADWEGLATYRNPDYEARYGEAYRRGDSAPTKQKWTDYEAQLKKAEKTSNKSSATALAAPTVDKVDEADLTEREQAIVKVLNEYYGESLPDGERHKTYISQTAPCLLMLTDNSYRRTLCISRQLDYIMNWTDKAPYELENCISYNQQRPRLYRPTKEMQKLFEKAGIDKLTSAPVSRAADPLAALPFDRWCDQIESFFDVYPCLREVCEPHPRRLWPFLLFASAAMLGTCMDLCYYYFYANEGERQRLNYIIWGVGDPASGKHCLQRICDLLLAPIIAEGALADESTNGWKSETDAKGQNKDRELRPAIYNRMFGYRSSNSEFIRSMINCKVEVDGEMMGLHMVTCSSEKDVEIGKAGSWISRSTAVLLSFHGEWDSQHYSNKQSVSGRYRVFWNQIETFCPITLPKLVNERNVNSGLDTRTCTIPMGRDDFKIMPLRRKEDSRIDAYNETLKQWAYRLDQRRGELPLWPLVEHVHEWLDQRRAIAEFNDEDRAEWLLLKRIPYHMINVTAPWVDMRHTQEREQTGTYTLDATDFALADLVGDIQYRTQMFWYYELHRMYYENQLRDAAQQRRRTNKFVECFRLLPEEFTTEQFAQTFGYANTRAAQKTLQRLEADKAIERTMRGHYKKLVSELPTIW